MAIGKVPSIQTLVSNTRETFAYADILHMNPPEFSNAED